ncbi:transmembrane protein [Gossypium australe]|uniref:Transmembrane protein n=1 Tax=Gossypium australe TaxID=47621 RepID=A0A5B6VEU8_9ROSI|nr:transmembrane protein [Gossypium australe]
MLPSLHLLSSPSLLSLPPLHNPYYSPLFLLQKPTFLSAHSKPHLGPFLAHAQGPITTIAETQEEEEGPFELPPSSTSTSIFATNDDPTPLQTATSVLLTGAIGVFLFRSLRRRAKRAKELVDTKKSLKEEALDNLKAISSASIDTKSSTPSAVQALLGSVAAGVITLILYKFTTTIEASLNRQTVSDNFSLLKLFELLSSHVRQITITIRTIVNGLCYLATFVFGINSLGLFLYSGQLALNSFMDGSSSKENESKSQENVGSVKEDVAEGMELTSRREDQSPDDKQ